MVQIRCSDDKDEVSVCPSFVGLAVLAPVSRTDHTRHKCRQEFTGIYEPMIYKAPYVMLLMLANPLRGQMGGGWALEIETFLGPVICIKPLEECDFGKIKIKPIHES
jgi:hypothetical protein